MSKLMERRAAATKKSTILTSPETVRDAISIGESLLNQWMQEGLDDPKVDQLASSIDYLKEVSAAPNSDSYLDDSYSPEIAQKVKQEVDMIANWRGEQRPAKVTQTAPVGKPSMASKKDAAGSADSAFVTDRDEKGQPKAPEKADVPRLAADKEAARKKKKEAEDPAAGAAPIPPAPAAAAPVPPPAPAPAPAAPAPGGPVGDGSLDTLFESLPSEFIAQLVKDLTGLEGFEANKSVQAAVERLAEILKNRPVEPVAPEAPKAASSKAASPIFDLKRFGGLALVGFEDEKDASAKVAVTPPGISESLMHKLKDEYPGEKDKAYATAWSIHNKKESSQQIEAAFDAGAKYAAAIIARKIASGNGGAWFVQDQDTMDVTDGGSRVPEIAKAHSERDDNTGIKRPETTAPIKLAAEMSTSKAVKEAERLGETLKRMYLDAKPLVQTNSSRPVREAVEAIFRAGDMFDEAVKVLNKQEIQEESAAEAEKIKDAKGSKGKQSSVFGGLKLVAAAE